jgi:hypothetical protein
LTLFAPAFRSHAAQREAADCGGFKQNDLIKQDTPERLPVQ